MNYYTNTLHQRLTSLPVLSDRDSFPSSVLLTPLTDESVMTLTPSALTFSVVHLERYSGKTLPMLPDSGYTCVTEALVDLATVLVSKTFF